MNESYLAGVLLGALAALMMNIGKGVQKQYVHVFLAGRGILGKDHRRSLVFWLLGLGLTGSAAVPFSLGLKLSESPSAISAMTGIGLIGLGFYAVKVIHESFGKNDFIGIAMVVIGTSLLAYTGSVAEVVTRDFVVTDLVIAIAILMFASGLACFLSRYFTRIHGIAFGATAGMFIGLAIFMGDLALLQAGGSFSGQLSNPFPYVALVFAVSATVVTQFGFLKSRALEVVSAVNSATILTPLLLEVVIYGVYPTWFDLVLVFLIVSGVLFLSRGAASKVSA